LINEIKQLVSLENASNMQSLMRDECINDYHQKKFIKEDYIKRLKDILEYTISYKAVVAFGKKYLTNIEIACVQNIIFEADWSYPEMEECISALLEVYGSLKFPGNYANMYEFIMLAVSSKLGDKGAYEQSNSIMNNILAMSLKNRRIRALDDLLYVILWNNIHKEKKEIQNRYFEEREIRKCIRLCELSKKFFIKNFFENKIR